MKTRNWLWCRSSSESSDLPARLGCWTINVWWFGGSSANQDANRKTRNLLWGRSFSESPDSGGRRQFGPQYQSTHTTTTDRPASSPPPSHRRQGAARETNHKSHLGGFTFWPMFASSGSPKGVLWHGIPIFSSSFTESTQYLLR
jgi:hypothetical protein